ncbi:unnamed protein product, partial [Rotaria sp. Silwood1]
MVLFLLILLFIIFIILRFKSWIINYIKVLQTYKHIPCPPHRLPLLGNLFNLPLNPY